MPEYLASVNQGKNIVPEKMATGRNTPPARRRSAGIRGDAAQGHPLWRVLVKTGWDSDFFESYLKANGPPGKYRPAVSEDARRIAELERRVAVLECDHSGASSSLGVKVQRSRRGSTGGFFGMRLNVPEQLADRVPADLDPAS